MTHTLSVGQEIHEKWLGGGLDVGMSRMLSRVRRYFLLQSLAGDTVVCSPQGVLGNGETPALQFTKIHARYRCRKVSLQER